jgi:RNA polymerase sigma-70 factor, ECF subfamily
LKATPTAIFSRRSGAPSLHLSLVEDLEARLKPSPEVEVTQLFEQLRNPLLRYSLSLGLAVHDAEEVVQEAFLALFRHVSDDKSRANLPAWMFRVVHNLGLKKRIRNLTHLKRHGEEKQELTREHPDPTPTAEEQLVVRQQQQRFWEILQTLPDQDRFCIHLRAEGLRYREIAEVLGISLGGVALSLQRSFARLRESEVRSV